MPKRVRANQILINLTKLIKEMRLERGFSHEVLARRAGITRPALSHIESGKRNPSMLVCLKLAHGLDQELSELIKQSEAVLLAD